LSVSGKNETSVENEVINQCCKLNSIIPEIIFGYDDITLEEVVGKQLKNINSTMATAESCTGGNISALITSIPGSSAVYKGSIIAYSNEIKNKLLSVSEQTLEKYGAVSKQTVEEMCKGLLQSFNTDYAISASGIAGPDGGTNEKPVGTTWIAVATKNKIISRKFLFGNNRFRNIKKASITALNMLRELVNE